MVTVRNVTARVFLFALTLLVSPLALAHTPPRSPSRSPSRPPPNTQPNTQPRCRLTAGAVFVGQYLCAQGITALTLHVTEVHGAFLRATFVFSHAPTNVSGSYTLTGTCTATSVSLSPEAWQRQPPGYVMVGLHGELSADTSRYHGAIAHPSCGNFDLTRQ